MRNKITSTYTYVSLIFLEKNDVVIHIIDCVGEITTFSYNDVSVWIYTRVL